MKLFNRRKVKRNPKIEIIPMVDVMFLLLVFYILSSLALHSQKGVPVSLPRADTSQAGDSNQELVLTISEGGEYFLGAEKVDQQNIGEAIRTFAASRGGLEVGTLCSRCHPPARNRTARMASHLGRAYPLVSGWLRIPGTLVTGR